MVVEPRTGSQLRRFAPIWLLGILLAVGLLVRFGLALDDRTLSVDGFFYMDQARELVVAHRLPLSSFPPGWPLLMIPALLLRGVDQPIDVLRAAQYTNVILGGLFPLLTFWFLCRRTDRWLALAGAALLTALPLNIMLSKGDMSDLSYACGVLAAWLLWNADKRFAAGATLSFAYLIRPEGLLIGVGLTAYRWLRTRRIPWTFGLGLLVCLVPYVVYLKLETGHWSLSAKAHFLTQATADKTIWQYVVMMADNVRTLTTLYGGLVGIPFFLAAVAGLARLRWADRLFLLPLLVLPLFDFAMDARFLVPYMPFFCLAVIGAVAWVVARVGRGRRFLLTAGLAGVIAVGVVLAAIDDVPAVRRRYEDFPGLQDAGLWLGVQVPSDTVVASYKPYASFWAGCRFAKTPDLADAEQIIAAVRAAGAEYLVVNVHLVLYHIQGLKPLLSAPLPENLQDDVTLVWLNMDYEPGYQNTAVYRIESP